MSEAIVLFFEKLNLTKEAIVFFISMLPVVELRGAIPVGVAFTLFGAALALAGYGINQGAQGLNTLAPALTQ